MSQTIRKYQAFVSSTFRDLHDVRERITWEILKIGFIPVGMENFSAMDERGWTTIAKAITHSDYYVVIVAGLYGSVDDSGKSWTQREYEYAREVGVPVLAFIRDRHHVPSDAIEDGEAAAKLNAFVATLRTAHHVETWTGIDDLRAKVPVALLKIAREDESEGHERPGWYRGTALSAALEELAMLSAENRQLRATLDEPLPREPVRMTGEEIVQAMSYAKVKPVYSRLEDAVLYHADINNDGAMEWVLYEKNPVGFHNDNILGVYTQAFTSGAMIDYTIPLPQEPPFAVRGPCWHAERFLRATRAGIVMTFLEGPNLEWAVRYMWKDGHVTRLGALER